jgi:hypothetical protein
MTSLHFQQEENQFSHLISCVNVIFRKLKSLGGRSEFRHFAVYGNNLRFLLPFQNKIVIEIKTRSLFFVKKNEC